MSSKDEEEKAFYIARWRIIDTYTTSLHVRARNITSLTKARPASQSVCLFASVKGNNNCNWLSIIATA